DGVDDHLLVVIEREVHAGVVPEKQSAWTVKRLLPRHRGDDTAKSPARVAAAALDRAAEIGGESAGLGAEREHAAGVAHALEHGTGLVELGQVVAQLRG